MDAGAEMDLIVACAWCGRVQMNGWREAAEAIRELRSYDRSEPPRFTHGICDDCFDRVDVRRRGPSSPESAVA